MKVSLTHLPDVRRRVSISHSSVLAHSADTLECIESVKSDGYMLDTCYLEYLGHFVGLGLL